MAGMQSRHFSRLGAPGRVAYDRDHGNRDEIGAVIGGARTPKAFFIELLFMVSLLFQWWGCRRIVAPADTRRVGAWCKRHVWGG